MVNLASACARVRPFWTQYRDVTALLTIGVSLLVFSVVYATYQYALLHSNTFEATLLFGQLTGTATAGLTAIVVGGVVGLFRFGWRRYHRNN